MMLLGVYNYTVVLTYLAMLVSFVGIHFAFNDQYNAALLCLMVSGVFDMFDGRVASTKKNRSPAEKLFGIQIDSMCDLICYGAFPALIVYHLGNGSRLVTSVCALYCLCAMIRLSWFNVDETERQNKTTEARHEYRGLPVTTAALVMPAIFIFCYYTRQSMHIVGVAALAAMGICFITPFKLIKPGNVGKVVMMLLGAAEIVLLIMGAGRALEQGAPAAKTQADAGVVDTFTEPVDVNAE